MLPVGILAAGSVAYSILSVEPEEAKSPPAEEQIIRTSVTELQVQDYLVVIKAHGSPATLGGFRHLAREE